ncbi:hypothetical protein [Propioniciclava flava]|uniref:Uncharacterized protein n=1 Tax=Propioniciclava flava TaxID=2072026 RepID=A0A4Q2EHT7_9ACTN|nr:hypothetical protein [Propioniciclava flava]RXW33031.1 hypothetical protein C1706_04005 [Propioniciclava flava]
MIVVPVIVALALLTLLATLQALLALGQPVGEYLWGGRHRCATPRLRQVARWAVLAYAVAALVLLSRADLLPGHDAPFIRALAWIVFAYGACQVILNAMSSSRRQRKLMMPVSTVLMLSVLLIAAS